MSWLLQFYRRVGDPSLTLEEVTAFFADHPEYGRLDSGDPGGTLNAVRFSNRELPPSHSYVFVRDFKDEEIPQPDFPFEETGLSLEVDYDLSEAAALPDLAAAMHTLDTLASALRLLVSDPQVDQELPDRPDTDRLAQSYIHRRLEILETVSYFERRKKRMLVMAGGLLLAALTMAIILVLSGQ